MSKIWRINSTINPAYARLLEIASNLGGGCPKCGVRISWQYDPIIVEWDRNSTQIGDFVFAGANLVVRRSVAEQLDQFSGSFRVLDLTFLDVPHLRKPEHCSKRKLDSRIWLPYEGPPLVQVVPTHIAPLAEGSSVEVESRCSACGRIQYKKVWGIESEVRRTRVPRVKGEGLFFSAHDLKGVDLFFPEGLKVVLCTESVKQFVMSKGFTNVDFLEYGEIV